MKKVDITLKVFELIEEHNAGTAAQYLSKDFKIRGPSPEIMPGGDWLALQENVLDPAFPDWAWNISKIRQHGEHVHMSYSVTGTNTGDLDLTQMGMGVIPATGKSIHLEQDEALVEFSGSKICKIDIKINPNTGITGILTQLGAAMPPA